MATKAPVYLTDESSESSFSEFEEFAKERLAAKAPEPASTPSTTLPSAASSSQPPQPTVTPIPPLTTTSSYPFISPRSGPASPRGASAPAISIQEIQLSSPRTSQSDSTSSGFLGWLEQSLSLFSTAPERQRSPGLTSPRIPANGKPVYFYDVTLLPKVGSPTSQGIPVVLLFDYGKVVVQSADGESVMYDFPLHVIPTYQTHTESSSFILEFADQKDMRTFLVFQSDDFRSMYATLRHCINECVKHISDQRSSSTKKGGSSIQSSSFTQNDSPVLKASPPKKKGGSFIGR